MTPPDVKTIACIADAKAILHRGQKRYDNVSSHTLEYRPDATAVRL